MTERQSGHPAPVSLATPPPIAIGALGGSGTRIVAQLFKDAGVYMGGDLNRAHDNLWYTLLFKRREVLVEPRQRLDGLMDLFFQRMQGKRQDDPHTLEMIRMLANADRPQHAAGWLQKRAESFLSDTPQDLTSAFPSGWGWKEPNTHILSEHFLGRYPTLRYIHVARNGLDMAFSKNRGQLRSWAPVFLGENVQPSPRTSLKYWCRVHQRIEYIARAYPDRVLMISFDRLCQHTKEESRRLFTFAGRQAPDKLVEAFALKVQTPESSGGFRSKNMDVFDAEDVDYVASLGFVTQ